jgi:hypothetical protein
LVHRTALLYPSPPRHHLSHPPHPWGSR